MTTLADVADPACCPFCGSNNLDWHHDGWADCHDCTATHRYSRQLGEIVDHNPPDDLQAVSNLLHKLRRGDVL